MASPAAASRRAPAAAAARAVEEVIDLCNDDDNRGAPHRRAVHRQHRPIKKRTFVEVLDPPFAPGAAAAAAPPSVDRRPDPPAWGSAVARRNPEVVNLFDESQSPSGILASSYSRKRRRRQQFVGKRDPNETPGDSSDDVQVVKTVPKEGTAVQMLHVKPAPVQQPQMRVLEVFPDCDLEYIKEQLQKNGNNVETVISLLVEKSYPKVKIPKTAAPGTVRLSNNQQQYKYDYDNTESFISTSQYISEAHDKLLDDFPFLSKIGATKILAECKNHYAVAHAKVTTAVKGTNFKAGEELEEVQYNRLLEARRGLPLDQEQTQRVESLSTSHRKLTIKQKRRRSTSVEVVADIRDPILAEEVSYIKRKLDDWMDGVQKNIQRRIRKEACKKDGTGVECQCCFDESPIDDMVACRDQGHLFCADYLKAYVENQVFGQGNLGIDPQTKKPALEVKCFHGDGCFSGFPKAGLDKALPDKVMRKYDELQAQVTLDSAGLDDVCTCPKCGFQAALDPSVRVFCCPVEGCLFESCRECGEEAHIPLRCDEVEKDEEKKGRLTVEEAISQARIRKCPNCGKAFIKADGCNKMTCGHCGQFSCYVCRQKLPKTTPYKHFCQTPHCQHKNCNQCPLYTKTEQDDDRMMREAGLKAAKEVAGEADIDVDGMLKAGRN